MPTTEITVNARKAANYMLAAPNVAGSAMGQLVIATTNDSYILPLRDAIIAAGKPGDDPMVTNLNAAHYLSSDAIERGGSAQYALELIDAGRNVMAAIEWLEPQPAPTPAAKPATPSS